MSTPHELEPQKEEPVIIIYDRTPGLFTTLQETTPWREDRINVRQTTRIGVQDSRLKTPITDRRIMAIDCDEEGNFPIGHAIDSRVGDQYYELYPFGWIGDHLILNTRKKIQEQLGNDVPIIVKIVTGIKEDCGYLIVEDWGTAHVATVHTITDDTQKEVYKATIYLTDEQLPVEMIDDPSARSEKARKAVEEGIVYQTVEEAQKAIIERMRGVVIPPEQTEKRLKTATLCPRPDIYKNSSLGRLFNGELTIRPWQRLRYKLSYS